MLVRLSPDNLSLIVVLVVVVGNPESLIAFMADDLVDVSSGELQMAWSLHKIFKVNISFWNNEFILSTSKYWQGRNKSIENNNLFQLIYPDRKSINSVKTINSSIFTTELDIVSNLNIFYLPPPV